jgi:hypothetical protein
LPLPFPFPLGFDLGFAAGFDLGFAAGFDLVLDLDFGLELALLEADVLADEDELFGELDVVCVLGDVLGEFFGLCECFLECLVDGELLEPVE